MNNKTQNIIRDYVNRQVLLGLLFAQMGAVSLHLQRLPFWLILLTLVVFIWRVQIFRSQWRFPNRIIRVCLVFFSLVAVMGYYREWYALEPMVTLLVIAFLLKLLEVERKRDAVLLVFVGFFVTASAFLFNQGIIISVFGVVILWLLVTCLLVIHSSQSQYFSRRTFRVVSILLLQSVPLMLLMLFVFPRIGALWSVPLQSSSSVTGVSDSMSPGDFSQLTRSRSLAFRVKFENNRLPPSSQQYWRGVVLTRFDGRQWERKEKKPSKLDLSYVVDNNDQKILYEVILETTNTNWLYGIPYAELIASFEDDTSDTRVIRSSTNEILISKPVTQRIKYTVRSSLNYSIEESQENLLEAQLLPSGFNPKTLEQARQWRKQAGSTKNYILRVLDFYNQSFTYTLSPPKLGKNTADEFLFTTQRGFCEHFASSFVILMRAVGIPARVVTGYQGGEWNEEDQYLIVRQYDAHAWAEVWFSDKGWVRVDPTAAVAPNRIEQGLLNSLPASEQGLLEPTNLPSFIWVNQLLLKWDSLNYRWQRWVLSYDQDKQSELLKKVLGEVTPSRLAMLLIIPSIIMLGLFSVAAIRSHKPPPPKEMKLYHLLIRKLKRRGVTVHSGMTLTQLFSEAIAANPDKKTILLNLQAVFDRLLYQAPDSEDIQPGEIKQVKLAIRSL